MARNIALTLTLVAAAMLCACAAPQSQRVTVSDSATKAEADKQRDITIKDFVEDQKRLARVYGLLRTRATALCPEHGPYFGLHTMNKPDNDFGAAFERVFGIEKRLTTLFVDEGGPAARAGLQPRDVILRVNGTAAPDTQAANAAVAKIGPEDPVVVDLERDSKPMTMTIQPVRACKYPARVVFGQVINAFADGKSIAVTRGMMSFARTDVELATVLGHEMAHNTMKHMEAKTQNMQLGLIADVAAAVLSRGRVSGTNFAQVGAQVYSQEFEAEADYVGLYLLAVAGFSIEDAPNFWRRMASVNPSSIQGSHSASHPSTPYRMLALEETVQEIKDKLAQGVPLKPNMKDGKPQRTPSDPGKN